MVIALGCASEPTASLDASVDRTVSDGFVDGGDAVVDGVDERSADAVTADVVRGPGPVAPATAPERLTVTRWLTSPLPAGSDDEVFPAFVTDQFDTPSTTAQSYGTFWDETTPDAMGTFAPPPAGGTAYFVGELDVPDGVHVFARADVMLGVFARGGAQPGDVYASGKIRVPVATRAGRNLVAFRALGGRGRPRAELYATRDELYLNLDDVTVPDLPVGEARAQYVGVAVLNLTDAPALDVTASVEANDALEATTVALPSLPAGAVTQVPFEVRPRRAFTEAGAHVTVALRVASPSLHFTYRREVTLDVVAADATHRRSFRSAMDGSAQYMGVVPPRGMVEGPKALVLTLHGAGVEAIGQARAYSAKDGMYIVAATNRRPFGFDWEEYGRHDAIEVLEHAQSIYRIDPTRVYLAGHSMGGHGTWNVGVLFPGRFATLGPSAGWSSFYSYTGRARPRGAFARSQASSDTNVYLSNLARRGVYVIHGSADDNVPVREGRAMVAAARMVTSDVVYHEQPGAGHWWDGDASPGADCVDWPPLFEFMRAHTLDPAELDFTFTTPGVWVNPTHAYATLRSAVDPMMDLSITSARAGDTVTVTTRNVRSMDLSASMLRARGIARVVVDGAAFTVGDTDIAVGPRTGKRPGVHGPFNEALQQPFCFVYPDDGDALYQRYASYLVSVWSVNGNGHGCAVPWSAVSPALRRTRNLVYVGIPRARVNVPDAIPFTWDDASVSLGDRRFEAAALAFVFPDGDRLGAAVTAAMDARHLLYRVQPFTSGFAVPDYMVWNATAAQAAGFFQSDWRYAAPATP